MSDQRSSEAIDIPRVDAWLSEHVSGATPPFRYELITGGRSNLTFSVNDAAAHHFVLRRPPLGTLLATAHDVVREYRIAAALAETPVPVATVLAVCEDAAINGTPFAVTGFVDGVVLDTVEKANPLVVSGTLPERMRGATVRVSLVRSAASSPVDPETVPTRPGPERDKVLLANHRRANQFEIVSKQIRVKERQFRLTLDVPKDLPKGKLRLRVVATTDAEVVIRVQSVEVIR